MPLTGKSLKKLVKTLSKVEIDKDIIELPAIHLDYRKLFYFIHTGMDELGKNEAYKSVNMKFRIQKARIERIKCGLFDYCHLSFKLSP